MTEPKRTERGALLLWLGQVGPKFPCDIMKHFGITKSRCYTLLKHEWFDNVQMGRILSVEGRLAYSLLKEDGRAMDELAKRLESEEVVEMKLEKRNRMIVDLPADYQMAIRLRAVKSRCTTGEVVEDAVRIAFPVEVKEAEEASKKQL